jgi:hypothetical protein
MTAVKKLTGLAIASAAAAAFSMATVSTTAYAGTDQEGKCMGVNACKGMSSCKTSSSGCAGKNACKGKGYVTMTKKQCMQVAGDNYVFKLLQSD